MGRHRLYQSALEEVMWGQVRLWLDAAYASLHLGSVPTALGDVWEAICQYLVAEYVVRPLDLDERLAVLRALFEVQYPGYEELLEQAWQLDVEMIAATACQ